jgi:hypothetical protein
VPHQGPSLRGAPSRKPLYSSGDSPPPQLSLSSDNTGGEPKEEATSSGGGAAEAAKAGAKVRSCGFTSTVVLPALSLTGVVLLSQEQGEKEIAQKGATAQTEVAAAAKASGVRWGQLEAGG